MEERRGGKRERRAEMKEGRDGKIRKEEEAEKRGEIMEEKGKE